MVFQSGALLDSLTVAENIAFPLEGQPGLTDDDINAYVAKLAHMLEVEDVLEKLPSELSTGTKRAVAIARALAQNPEAILYDEPTTMVDPIMAGHMGDLILRLKEAFHKTSIVVTHDTHLARRLADTIVFLQDGKSQVFASWADFEKSNDPLLRDFLLQDELIPALDVTL
jgi:phospholipid/cholesterol/gamma-HCH transport system ATP-binding protein